MKKIFKKNRYGSPQILKSLELGAWTGHSRDISSQVTSVQSLWIILYRKLIYPTYQKKFSIVNRKTFPKILASNLNTEIFFPRIKLLKIFENLFSKDLRDLLFKTFWDFFSKDLQVKNFLFAVGDIHFSQS